MTAETLDGQLGRSVAIDLCLACQSFWFDQRESLQLTPGSTLRLFRLIGEQAKGKRAALAAESDCPRCGARLVLAHDRQGNAPFQYRRCPQGHGRLITFFDFLREKSFIRPLTPAQVEELRRNVQAVNCSNCGAAIDLARSSTCAHCGSPLSMLDNEQAERLITQLREADRASKTIDPALPLELERARREVERTFASFERDQQWYAEASDSGLVGAGISALLRWLAKPAGVRRG